MTATQTVVSSLGILAVVLANCLPAAHAGQSEYQPSFDCRRNKGADEQTICFNGMLNSLDNRMAEAYEAAIGAAAPNERDTLRQAQRSWLAERQKCGADANCIERLYDRRLDELLLPRVVTDDAAQQAVQLLEYSFACSTMPIKNNPNSAALQRRQVSQKFLGDRKVFSVQITDVETTVGETPNHEVSSGEQTSSRVYSAEYSSLGATLWEAEEMGTADYGNSYSITIRCRNSECIQRCSGESKSSKSCDRTEIQGIDVCDADTAKSVIEAINILTAYSRQ